MQKEYYTYVHYRNDTNKIFYIGKGKGNRAWAYGRNKWWKGIVEKHGYTVDILAYWSTEAEAFEHEKFLIECFRKMGYELANLTDGGEGCSGRIIDEDTRLKISSSLKGIKFSQERKENISKSRKGKCIGIEFSQERKENISKSKLGKKLNPESITKRTESRKDYTVSAETRAKMSASRMGRIVSAETRAKISVKQKNKIISAETRAKMSASRMGKKRSAESCQKQSATVTGVKRSAESRAKMSAAQKSRPPMSAETKAKISEAIKVKWQLINQQKEQK